MLIILFFADIKTIYNSIILSKRIGSETVSFRLGLLLFVCRKKKEKVLSSNRCIIETGNLYVFKKILPCGPNIDYLFIYLDRQLSINNGHV